LSLDCIVLDPDEIPSKWYNIIPDLPYQLPPYKIINSGKEVRYLPSIFTDASSKVEFSGRRWVDIPREVLEAYIKSGRPMPLRRARRLEDSLKTPAKIYYKCEEMHPVGTFKTNTALPQAYWAMKEGYRRTVFVGSSNTRTKMAHAYSAMYFGLIPTVFISRMDAKRSPEHPKFLKEMLSADIIHSPSETTEVGRKALRCDHNQRESNVVRAEVEEAARKDDAVAVVSSFLNHALLTQTIMGLEAEKQLTTIEEKPDIIIAPVGGGSNFYGLVAPFVHKKLKKESQVKLLAVESETSAKLTQGIYSYIRLQGPISSYLGKTYEFEIENPRPEVMGIGIQTSNTAPLLGYLNNIGIIDTVAYPKDEKVIFEAAKTFLKTEGRLIAPESAYAVKAAIDEARLAKKEQNEKVILLSVSATTFMDFGEKKRYMKFMA
jgi:tryptophan synthase beta chain|tara:strand:+ start:147 stop:1445 length:1299 start_codon:yes stop_codon:yes gene_type:complete